MSLTLPIFATSQKLTGASKTYYSVIQVLGIGGNSNVYLVQATSGQYRGLLFALKLFLRIDESTRLGRFKKETDFLTECVHPAIMKVYDVGEYGEIQGEVTIKYPFIVVEYLPQTLFEAMRTGLSMAEKVSYSLQLLSGLAYLSSRDPQVVHRDIKPHNIFIRGKACMLGDFGLMKTLSAEEEVGDKDYFIDSTGPRLPRFYRTPDLVEYCRNKTEITVKSDVFQVGLVLAELFTGENPLKPCDKILSPVELNDLSDFGGDQAATIKNLIEKMLEFDPIKRPCAADIIDRWEGVFRSVIQVCHQLEGFVFR